MQRAQNAASSFVQRKNAKDSGVLTLKDDGYLAANALSSHNKTCIQTSAFWWIAKPSSFILNR